MGDRFLSVGSYNIISFLLTHSPCKKLASIRIATKDYLRLPLVSREV